jgi:hypothetical protein
MGNNLSLIEQMLLERADQVIAIEDDYIMVDDKKIELTEEEKSILKS